MITRRQTPLRSGLALALVAWLAGGCLSVRSTGSQKIGGTTGGVALRVFADDAARRAAQPGPRGLMSELERQAHGGWHPVFRSLDPAWTVMGLAPGRYRLRFPARLDESGHVERLDEDVRGLRVRAGEVTEVEAVLEHVSKPLVAVGVVAAVVAAVIISDWLDDHDLPLPPLPPPPPELAELVFYVALDVSTAPDWQRGGPGHSPVVTSHFPEDGALVAARRLRPAFTLSAPLVGSRLAADAVTVLGEQSGLIAGTTGYDGAHWLVYWEPADDLPRGESFHVTLAAEGIEDAGGRELATAVSFSFRTTP
jgi:hypothetical protein